MEKRVYCDGIGNNPLLGKIQKEIPVGSSLLQGSALKGKLVTGKLTQIEKAAVKEINQRVVPVQQQGEKQQQLCQGIPALCVNQLVL